MRGRAAGGASSKSRVQSAEKRRGEVEEEGVRAHSLFFFCFFFLASFVLLVEFVVVGGVGSGDVASLFLFVSWC